MMVNSKPFNRLNVSSFYKDRHPACHCCLLLIISSCAIVWLGTNVGLTQHSGAEFQKILREKAAFDEVDFAALEQGQTVVSLLPANDKREVAVCGLVNLHVPAEVFLQSFLDSMTKKSNPAILEIGRFSSTPTVNDLQSLTFEDRDIDDMKDCIVGDCRLKLSAAMIERFHKEIDWQAPDYRIQASQLLRVMLLDYVRDYLARGDGALIEYSDKSRGIRLAEEQRALMSGSTYISQVLPEFPQHLKTFPKSEISLVENAIVWSKIKFGLKPVIAINHILVYKREQASGPQVLIAAKQIYANHYFDSSLALTAFVNIPDASPGAYLFYENRSRADGLEGAFSQIKRSIVEDKAVDGLRTILESSKASLNTRALNPSESTPLPDEGRSSRGWKVRRVQLFKALVFSSLLLITAFVAFYTLGNYNWKRGTSG